MHEISRPIATVALESGFQRTELSVNKNSGVIQRASAIFLLSGFVMLGALTFADFRIAMMIVLEAVPLIVIGVLLFFEAFAHS